MIVNWRLAMVEWRSRSGAREVIGPSRDPPAKIANRKSKIRFGVSRTEVVVVILVVLAAAGLLMVALLPARTNAQRLRCMNHLKELGQSIVRYHETHKQLPPSHLAPGYATWAVLLGPYLPLTKTPLASWDQQRPYYAQPENIRQDQIPQFFCPARRLPPQNSLGGDVPTQPGWGKPEHYAGALGDYACAIGDGSVKDDWAGQEANGSLIPALVLQRQDQRVLKWKGRLTLEELQRGKQRTILLGEKHIPAGQEGQAVAGDGSLYNGDHPPSFARLGGPGFAIAASPEAPFNRNFGSAHSRVCHFLMAELNVEPLTPAISERVLGDLIRR